MEGVGVQSANRLLCVCGCVYPCAHTRVSVCVSVAWADPSHGGGLGEAFVLTAKGDRCSSVLLFLAGSWLPVVALCLSDFGP